MGKEREKERWERVGNTAARYSEENSLEDWNKYKLQIFVIKSYSLIWNRLLLKSGGELHISNLLGTKISNSILSHNTKRWRIGVKT